eukprot:c25044_g1_i2 orf=666-2519(+)
MQAMNIMEILQATKFLILLRFVLHTSAEDDTACLTQFKNSVTDPGSYLSNWDFGNSSAASVCSFVGVTCWNSAERRVLALKLEQAGLSGSFPLGLDKCKSLQSLSLAGNAFTGVIPSDICKQVQYITSLDLSQNSFTGSIPENLAQCQYLNLLHLDQNKLTGQIPWGIGILPRLTDLDLSSNLLNGTIPSSFTNRSSINQSPFLASAFQNNPDLCGPPLSNSCGGGSSSKGLVVGVTVGVVVVIVLLGTFIAWRVLARSQKKRSTYYRDGHKWAKRIKAPKSVTVSMFYKPLVKLRLSDLMAATNGFSKENMIASGRTGTTYKATMPDGSIMAIKRLQMSSFTEKQFKSEMDIVGNLRQRNLVPLLGYCVADGEKLLVYKHMEHGSLRHVLHEVPEEDRPDWTTRLKMGIGAARGLAYLHHSCNPRVIHRNISASSILVDEDYEARITDFGLARFMNPLDTHVSTFVNGDFGDVGYVAPEYMCTLVATIKGDVYSFGVVLLELVTGQKAMDVCGEGDFKGNLSEWISYLSNAGRVQDAIDVSLKGKGFDNELLQFLRVACACVLSASKERPTMYEVYQLLRAIGEKFNLIDENDELPPVTDANDEDYANELIVAVET